MPDNKQVDGIKKLSKDELENSRRILLEYIGEEDLRKKSKVPDIQPNKMDSVSEKKFYKENLEEKKELKKPIDNEAKKDLKKMLGVVEVKQKKESEIMKKKRLDAEKRLLEQENQKREIEREKLEQEKARIQQALEDKKKREAEEAVVLEKARKDEEKKRQEDEGLAKLKIQEEKKRKLEEERQKKIQAEEKAMQKILDQEKKELAKEERKNKRKEKRKKFFRTIRYYRTIINRLLIDIGDFIKHALPSFFYSLIVLGLFIIFFHLIFSLFIYNFSPDNSISRKIAKVFPVPAIVSSEGIVWYYDYIDTKDELNLENKNIKIEILKKIVLQKLADKYNLDRNNLEEVKAELDTKAKYDDEINSVGISRIKKIKELIKNNDDFTQVSSKYGDKLEKINVENKSEVSDVFGKDIGDLKVGEVSDIVYGDDGYYIFRRYANGSDYAYSYVFVYNITLEEYLEMKVREIKAWSFVD